MLTISRYCGRERLPRGERVWRQLALRVEFSGELRVFGYGVVGNPGREHRRAMLTGQERGLSLADYEPGLIRVWLPCACAAAEFDNLKPFDDPLSAFAHELGHHVMFVRRDGDYSDERIAERYGRMLLRGR